MTSSKSALQRALVQEAVADHSCEYTDEDQMDALGAIPGFMTRFVESLVACRGHCECKRVCNATSVEALGDYMVPES